MGKTHKDNKYQQHTENGLTKGFVMQQIQKKMTQKNSSSTLKDYKRDKNWKKWVN